MLTESGVTIENKNIDKEMLRFKRERNRNVVLNGKSNPRNAVFSEKSHESEIEE